MKMKTLLSAAHAAGYALAPSEEQFHAPDGGTLRAFGPKDLTERDLAVRNLPAIVGPRAPSVTDAFKGFFSGVLTRRATA